jgi:gluconate 5-dehydrogenase
MFRIDGKVALITGGGRGIGLTMARGLARAGAQVLINDIDYTTAEQAARRLAEEGCDATPVAFDVAQEASVREAVGRLEATHGGVDLLVNNAGIHRYGELATMPLTDWQRVIDVNLTGAFLTARAVVHSMLRKQRGKIINICSLMSEVTRPTTGNYTAAKGGLKMLTRAMAVEWGRHGIQANGIGPGYLLTDMTRQLAERPEFDAWVKQRTPAGRWGTPEDLVGAAVFLASPASDFVNGQILYVDGGFLASI